MKLTPYHVHKVPLVFTPNLIASPQLPKCFLYDLY